MEFTQHLRPDGATKRVWVERDADTVRKARALLAQGCTFHIEETRPGDVSMTVEDQHQEVVSIRLTDNGPPVLVAVDELVTEAYERVVG